MGKNKRNVVTPDPLDREVKLLVTFVLIAFVIGGLLPFIPHFIGGLIQYADAAQFYIKPDERVQLQHTGAGASCPTITGPASATSVAGGTKAFQHFDDGSASGCHFNTYIIEASLFPQEWADLVANIPGSGPAGGFRIVINLDEADTDSLWNCEMWSLDDPDTATSQDLVDPRINATKAYNAIRDNLNRLGTDTIPTWDKCRALITQGSQSKPVDESKYWDSQLANQTWFGWGISGAGFLRDTTGDREAFLDDIFLKFSVPAPVNHTNNWWQMQEHPMYSGSYPVISDGFFGIDGTTFTMDTGTTNTDRGQVVVFKQFNKTEFNFTNPDIRVQGGIMSLGSSDNVHLHVEVRDGNFQAGQTEGLNAINSDNLKTISGLGDGSDQNLYFEREEFMTFFDKNDNTLYSLGVYDLEDPTLGTADPYDISFRPNWSNSTSDIITVFVAVQDNSTSGRMIANITTIELENNIKYNFTDVTDFVFYEPDCDIGMATTDSTQTPSVTDNDNNCGLDYSNGLTQIENLTAGTITANTLPTPPNVENLTATQTNSIYLDWDHDLVNVTNFRIYRTSTEPTDTESYIDGLPTGITVGGLCATETSALVPNDFCGQGGSAFGMDLAGKMVSDMTWRLKRGGTVDSGVISGAVFNNIVGGGTDFTSVNNSTESYMMADVPTSFTNYEFTFRPPINSSDNSDGVGIVVTGLDGAGGAIDANIDTGGYTPKGIAYDTSTTWVASAGADWLIDVNIVNQTKLFSNPYVANTGNLTTNWTDVNTETDHTYFYRVVAMNGDVEGDTVFIANFTEPNLNLQVDQVFDSRAHLSWDNIGSDYYQIFKNGTMIADQWEENLYIDGNILIDTVYEYTVRGYDTTLGVYTANSTADLFGLIEKPANFDLERLNSTAIQLTWDTPQTSDPDTINSVLIQRRNTDYISENFESPSRFLGERYANDGDSQTITAQFPDFYREGIGDNFKLVWDHTGGSGQATLSCPNFGLRTGQLGSFGTPSGITQLQNCITFEIDDSSGSINGSSLHLNATSRRVSDTTFQFGVDMVKTDIPISEIDRVTFQKNIIDAHGYADSGHAGGSTGYGLNYHLENGTQRTIAVETRDDRNCTPTGPTSYYTRGEEFCHDTATTSNTYFVVRGIDDRPSDVFVTTSNNKFTPFTIDANATSLFSTYISSDPDEIVKIKTWDFYVGGFGSSDQVGNIFPNIASTYGFDLWVDDIIFKYRDGSGDVPIVNWQNVTSLSPATTSYTDTGLTPDEDYTYRIVAITNPTSPFSVATSIPAPDNVEAVADIDTVKITWDAIEADPDIDRYWIERNQTVIGTTDSLGLVLQDEFSTYPDNATADTKWNPTISGLGSTSDIMGVNVTADNLVWSTNLASDSRVTLDLLGILGTTLSDSAGNGDFTLEFTQQLYKDSNVLNDEPYIGLFRNDPTAGAQGTVVGIGARFRTTDEPASMSSAIHYSDGSPVAEFDPAQASDSDCGLQSSIFTDINTDNIADSLITTYHQFNKSGTTHTYLVGTSPDFTGLNCSVSWVSANDVPFIRYLSIITRSAGAIDSSDRTVYFDNIRLYAEPADRTIFIDTTQERGTNYVYRVYGENTGGNGTAGESNLVLTNDVPDQVENLQYEVVAGPPRVNLQWDELPYNDGEGNPSTGLNLTRYDIWRNNVTTGGGFFLLTSNLASSPPLNYYNDTDVVVGNQYQYQISGCNAIDCGDNSTSITANFPGDVVTPQNFTAIAINSTVFIDWEDDVNATSYVVLRNGSQIANPSASEYTDTTPAFNTLYNYSAYTVGFSANSSEAFQLVTTNDIPTAPQNLTGAMGIVIPDLEDVFLDWEHPADNGTGSPSTGVDIIHYQVERKQGVNPFAFLANTTDATPEYEDETVISGANYTYRVRGVNALGYSPYSNTFSLITTPLTPPNAPTNLTATPVSGTQINTEWLAPVSGDAPTNYVLQRRHVGFTGFITIATIPAPTLFYNNTGLLPGNTYDYRVRADNGAGSSSYSNIAQAVTFSEPTAPQSLNAVTLNNTSINVSWLAPSSVGSGILNYSLERETPVGGGFVFIANTTNLFYNDTGLVQNTIYNYRVRAANDIGYGAYSNQDNDRTHGVPDAPINLSYTTNGVSTITVEWDAPAYTGGVPLTAYTIDQAQGIGGIFVTVVPNDAVTPEDETFIGLLQETNYIYRIAGKNQYGTGAYSANLTAGTFIGPSEPENFNAVFNSTFPYSVFLSWETPLDDGGEPIQGYIVQRKDLNGVYQLIANVSSTTFNFTDTNLLQQTTHIYRVAAYGSIGDFTADQPVTTVVPPEFGLFNITDFDVVGDVLYQQYDLIITDCFPACTLTQADIERNGIVESNYAVGQPIVIGDTLNFTTFFIIPTTGTQLVNTTAIVTNLGATGDNETGVVTTQLEFTFPTSLYFAHNRNSTFNGLNFTLIRHPVPWDAECFLRGGQPSSITVSVLGGLIQYETVPLSNPLSLTATLSLDNVGFFNSPPLFNVIPNRNAYMTCEDPVGTQILAFTSFGTGNGTLALTGFTDQLGTFLGVPIPFIFVIIFCAIWTGRSAPTGIIMLAVVIGAMGSLGYFDPLTGNPTGQGTSLYYFWGFIVFLTIVGAFLGKRFF